MSTTERIRRAAQRELNRQRAPNPFALRRRSSFQRNAAILARLKPQEAGTQTLSVPFGPVTASRFPTKDPGFKISTKATDYGKKSVGHTYLDITNAGTKKGAYDKPFASAVLAGIEGRNSNIQLTDVQRNAAAKLATITHVSESQRVPGTPKVNRAVLRMVEAGRVSMKDAYTGNTPLFPPALRRGRYSGPEYMRRILKGPSGRSKPVPKHPLFDDLGGYMSDSSDEEP